MKYLRTFRQPCVELPTWTSTMLIISARILFINTMPAASARSLDGIRILLLHYKENTALTTGRCFGEWLRSTWIIARRAKNNPSSLIERTVIALPLLGLSQKGD